MAIGVAVANAILLVTCRRRRREGLSAIDAAVEAPAAAWPIHDRRDGRRHDSHGRWARAANKPPLTAVTADARIDGRHAANARLLRAWAAAAAPRRSIRTPIRRAGISWGNHMRLTSRGVSPRVP